MNKRIPTKMSDETIRFFIENVTDENGAVYADSLYYQLLHYGPEDNTFSPEYVNGELKIFNYTNLDTQIIVKVIECSFDNFKKILESSIDNDNIDSHVISSEIIDFESDIKQLHCDNESYEIPEGLTEREQLQYQAFLMDSYDDSSC